MATIFHRFLVRQNRTFNTHINPICFTFSIKLPILRLNPKASPWHWGVYCKTSRWESPSDGIHWLSLPKETNTNRLSKVLHTRKGSPLVYMCMFCSQPTERMCDLSHASGRDRVAGRMGGPGHTCIKIHSLWMNIYPRKRLMCVQKHLWLFVSK